MIRIGQTWQTAVQVNWKWRDAFLQAWGQRAIAFQMLLQAGRQIAATFCQTRREIRGFTMKIVANDLPVMNAKGDVDRGAITIMGIAFAVTLAVALCESNLRHQRDTECAGRHL